MSLVLEMDDRELVAAYSRLKRIPIATIVHNASKDFAKAAYTATPLAQKSTRDSEWMTFIDARTGRRRYIREYKLRKTRTQPKGLIYKGKPRKGDKPIKEYKAGTFARLGLFGLVDESQYQPHKVHIAKGYSKSTWIGVFRALGLPPRRKASKWAEGRSTATTQGTDTKTMTTITDEVTFDKWGKGLNYSSPNILEEGMAAARQIMTRQVALAMRREWRKQVGGRR